MKPLGINRVSIIVRDLDRAVKTYSEVLGTTFHEVSRSGQFPARVALSWDAGLELIAPQPGQDSEYAQYLEKNGEGLFGLVFAVDDIEESRRRAERLGIGIRRTIELNESELKQRFEGRFKKFKEYMLGEAAAAFGEGAATFGVRTYVGQIEPK